MRLRRVVVAGTVAALWGSMLTLLAGSGQLVAPRPAPIAEARDVPAAMAAARLQGSRVEVADERTPTRAVFANPGGTLTSELTPVPVRVRKGAKWVGVDTGLGKQPDGLVAPKAADGDLTLSPGGDGPLATLRRDGKTLSLSWPGELPAPELSGSQATYRDVFPGADLVMIAERDGFRQHLVVRDAEAARNPALKAITLAIKADGLTVTAGQDGSLRAADSTGAELFGAPPSTMWDAAGRTAPIGVSVDGGALVLTPDAKFLADPAVKYPVTVDPTLTTIQKWGWANVLSGNPGTSYWETSGDGNAQVGQCPVDLGGWCNGIGEGWSYFQYDTSGMGGRTLLGATFTTVVISSPDCSDREQVVYKADGGIWNGMTWNSRRGGGWNRTRSVPGVHSGACGTGWKEVGWDIPVDLIDTGGHTPLFLKAKDSTDQHAWRKYDPAQTVLKVNWNRTPDVPGGISTDPVLPAPCKFCGGVPYIAQDTMTLNARLSDPDGDRLYPQWRVSANGTEIASWDGAAQASGAVHTTQIGLGDRDGQSIGWWVHAADGATSSPPFSGTNFVVDRTRPDKAPTVGSELYTEDNRWHGGTDVPGTFVFGSNGVGDIDHYKYGWQDPPVTSIDADALGQGTSVKLTPPGDGPRTLYVRSYDRAGNESPQREYRFYVRAGNGPLAQWSMDGNAQDTAFLGDRHGTPHNGATFQAGGALGSAVKLDGVDDDVTAPSAIRNTAGFTASAWVNLQQNYGARAVVSQDGLKFPGFVLWYRAESDGSNARWVFGKPNSTDSDKGVAMATSAVGLPQLNTWTHLAGVYDPDAKEIRLFVDGKLAATAPSTAVAEYAAGPVRIGRTIWDGRPVDAWPGALDEVQLFDRPLSAAEITGLVSAGNVQTGHWKFDDDKGTTARNAVEGGSDAVLAGGAAFVPDGAVGRGLRLDGITGVASTPGPVLRTDQSFSVAAQVRLDAGADESGTFTVLSQDGEKICSFCLQYQNKHWVFVLPRTDEDAPTGYDWVSTNFQPVRDQWYHLAGTYDAADGKIRLYVDGELIGESARSTPWQARHAFRMGQALIRGVPAQRLPGTVDDVRVYSRAISLDEVRALVTGAGVTAATWRFDGDGTERNGKFPAEGASGAVWVAGQTNQPDPNDLALRLTGSGRVSTTAPVVHTDRSFSVTAWARLDQTGGQAAVVSQSGQHVAGFDLRTLSDGRWGFLAMNTDQPGTGDEATGPVAQPGVWTHLAGVYSKDRGRIELYVNGVLAGSAAHTGGFDATGAVQFGRSLWAGNPDAEAFTGAVDDVSLYSRALLGGEIQTMAGRDVSLAHDWTFDEGKGTRAGDAAGAKPATLAAGATFAPGRVGNALDLPGNGGYASTSGVDVRTDTSFTVSAWVNLKDNPCDTAVTPRCFLSAVSLDGGNDTSKFRLGHVVDGDGHDGNWIFEVPEADGSVTKAAVAVRLGELNSWVHLAGVYDAPTKTIWLYVDGLRKEFGTLLQPWQGSGGLQVGRSKTAGQWGGYWRGGVDDVRLYTGALTADRVFALNRSYPAAQPAALPSADVGRWKFDETTGTTAADSSGRGNTATLSTGAGWHAGRNADTGWFDGKSGFAETAGPVVDTSKSFSVSAWVYNLDNTRYTTVFGQDGDQLSAFYVQYDPTAKKWAAVAPVGGELKYVLSAEAGYVDGWVHLALVYDQVQGQLKLYVNGGLSGAISGVTVPKEAGKFAIGRCRWNGANACFFKGGVDDVRAFGGALTDAQIRKVHDDVPAAAFGTWRFDDGTLKDSSWVGRPATLTGTATYPAGPSGKALQLDGASAATTGNIGALMRDSFTVAAWAKLDRGDRVATVLGQDGARHSGLVLQYRPEVGRWIFGAATSDDSDADNHPLVYANSTTAPALGAWTHLTGVYDYPARQLRLYVNGELVGTKDNVLLWTAWGGLTIGRSLEKGVPAGFFTGAVDEVYTDEGVVPDDEIRARAGWAPPAGGQLGRFVAPGDHRSVSTTGGIWDRFAPIPAGFRFETPLGRTLPAGTAGTHPMFSCLKNDVDAFTSIDPGCEGATKLGELGSSYIDPPAGVTTMPVYRCVSNGERFDSNSATCEGQTVDGLLGYLPAYAPLVRYLLPRAGEHSADAGGPPPGYRFEGTLGLVARTNEPGTTALMSCVDGSDRFVSTNAACDGKTVETTAGYVWTQPPAGRSSIPLFQCASGLSAGELFVSSRSDCEGQAVRGSLGYVLTA
ncbi:LamG domain-containing protein [Streptomyces sp. MN03-5084-2B]|nr:LamG domain-containing protein [Streptomyces sp. MN03-5084-2B]